jgi:regulator of sigma E protease
MDILIKAAQLILSLSILVLIHEAGHFTAAKIFKTRVEKFYLFFNPWFSLFKFKKGETEYGIGWLPLGGFVKISGMIDESMDKEQMKKEPQPYEFRSKPAWQRLIIMIGGVFMNVVLAILIYIVMLAAWGETYLPNSSLKYGIVVDSLGQELGLQNGDKIISLDGEEVDDFNKITADLILDQTKTIQVERNNEILDINVDEKTVDAIINSQSPGIISYRIPFVVGGFAKDSPAKEAGLKKHDQIIGINEDTVLYFDEFKEKIQEYKNQDVNIVVLRDEKDTLDYPISIGDDGLIGVSGVTDLSYYFDLKTHEYTFFQAIQAGFKKTFSTFTSYLKQLRLIPKAYKSIGGFGTIGNLFPAKWDWAVFWNLTAFLSIILAIMNLLPIPALDGGHVLFLLIEMITGRKPKEKFLEVTQIIGMVILFSLLIYANGNDIIKLFNK